MKLHAQISAAQRHIDECAARRDALLLSIRFGDPVAEKPQGCRDFVSSDGDWWLASPDGTVWFSPPSNPRNLAQSRRHYWPTNTTPEQVLAALGMSDP